MAKSQGKKTNKNGRQGKQAAAPAPSGHAGTQPYQAHASRGSQVQTLSTLANTTQAVKRIEVMDNPGENHFAEALAKALGPMAKDPTARSQIVALVSRLEPEAAVSGFSNSNSTDPMQMLLLQVLAQSASQVQNNAVGGPGTQNSSAIFGTMPPSGIIPNSSALSNLGTMGTGGGASNAPAPTYTSKTLAMLLKEGVLTFEAVTTICSAQGIDVNDVCSAAYDQPTPGPRTRGTPKSAMRGTGGAKRTPNSVEFLEDMAPADDEALPQTPSLDSALDSLIGNIFTPASEPPVADAARDDFVKKCMEEHFACSGKLDRSRINKAAVKVGTKIPANCGLKGRGSVNQLRAFAETVAIEIYTTAKYGSSSTADPKRALGYTAGSSSRKRAKGRTGRRTCENASSTLFVIPVYHDIPIWNHVHYRSEVFDSSPPRKRWVNDWIADFLSHSRHDGPISVNTTQVLVFKCLASMCFHHKPSSAVFLEQQVLLYTGYSMHHHDRYILPRHWYVLLHTLESLLMDLRTTGSGSGPDAQDFRSLKGLLSMSIVFASRRPSHSRSALLLEALLSTGLHFGGTITWSGIRRDLALNAVYVKFSVYTGYCYIGETLTGARFFQHEAASDGGYRSQHVHRVISRLDSSLYDSLVINFPASVDRKHIERAMISQFDHYGTTLLNVLGRSSTYTIFGDEARSVRVSGLRDTMAGLGNNLVQVLST